MVRDAEGLNDSANEKTSLLQKENCTDPVFCKRRRITNIINCGFFIILGGVFIFVEFANVIITKDIMNLGRDFLDAIPLVIFYIVGLASCPNVTLCEEGMYVYTLGKTI